jgi:hypothetical protein
VKGAQKKYGQSYHRQLAKMLRHDQIRSAPKRSKEYTVNLVSTLVSIFLTILLVIIGIRQFDISEEQARISKEQTQIARQQLELSKALAHMGFEPYVDCDLVFPGPAEKREPFILIINKSPIKAESVTVDGYAMPFDAAGKAGPSIQRRTYPGHLFFKAEMKSYDVERTSVMRVPPPDRRPKDIVKIFYVFDLTYRRTGDLAEFKNRVAFELREDKKEEQVHRSIYNLQTHPFSGEIGRAIHEQKELMRPDTPESFLEY